MMHAALYQRGISFMQHSERQQVCKLVKYIWTLPISHLFTESIVESICSIIKAHHNYNREGLQGKRLKVLLKNIIMLPDDGTNRTHIVKWVATECGIQSLQIRRHCVVWFMLCVIENSGRFTDYYIHRTVTVININ